MYYNEYFTLYCCSTYLSRLGSIKSMTTRLEDHRQTWPALRYWCCCHRVPLVLLHYYHPFRMRSEIINNIAGGFPIILKSEECKCTAQNYKCL